ncbi:MAG: DNA primase [Bacteroidetes bacterium]|nr:DNA primase [Bacteroidota bacterium]MDA1333102.1 DNA primase [Bacteroidota bacterium]
MSIISDTSIEEVRSSADIVDVVGDYVRLKKRGSNFVGLCPFHTEKTPSFNVNPGLGIFKCFGCGEGGDVFSFVSRVEGLTFPESVRLLAERVGIVLPEADVPGEEASENESIYHALRFAARFFHDSLGSTDEAEVARSYLKKRGVTPEAVKTFGIGFAPDGWDHLIKAAEAAPINVEILEKAGLVVPRKDGSGHYDRYRYRLIFPIFSHVGKVLGFGGRILREDDEPKYINSPETAVYNKSRVLYGLYHAKNAIRSREEVILVEGYTDVVALYQAGVQHVVASSGTALTDDQVSALSRYARTIVLLYDADKAGLRAALRGIDLVLKKGLIPYAVRLPDGDDPDSYVRDNGGPAFEAYLRDHRQNFIDFVYENARAAGSMDTPEGRASVQRTIVQSVALIPDDLVRESYLRTASSRLDIPDLQLRPVLDAAMRGERRAVVRQERRQQARTSTEEQPAIRRRSSQEGPLPMEKKLLRLMLEGGIPMIEWIMGTMPLADFTDGPSRIMASELVHQYEDDSFDRQTFFTNVQNEDVRSLAADVMTLQVEPSENWTRRKNIRVPGLDENSTEAAASAMVLLKLHRVQEREDVLRAEIYRLESAGENTRELNQQLVDLKRFEKAVRERKFIASA